MYIKHFKDTQTPSIDLYVDNRSINQNRNIVQQVFSWRRSKKKSHFMDHQRGFSVDCYHKHDVSEIWIELDFCIKTRAVQRTYRGGEDHLTKRHISITLHKTKEHKYMFLVNKNVHSYWEKKRSLLKEEQFGPEVDHLTHSLVYITCLHIICWYKPWSFWAIVWVTSALRARTYDNLDISSYQQNQTAQKHKRATSH